MASREELQAELETFYPNVYFQPPANIQMEYPCIVYHKVGKARYFGDNIIYYSQQEYRLTVMDYDDPDLKVADRIEEYFQHCAIEQYYTADNLNHASIKLYY